MDRELGERCNVISFQYPLSAGRTSARIFAPSLAPRHFHPLSRPSFISPPARSYLMYDTPLRRRPNGTGTRLVFGTDHSPLSLRIWLCPGTSRRKSIRGPYCLPTRAIRIRAAHKRTSPVIASQRQLKYGTAKVRWERSVTETYDAILNTNFNCKNNCLTLVHME